MSVPGANDMSEKPIRIQQKRTKDWKSPFGVIAVDRSTPWGNPYKAGIHCDHQHAVDCHRYLVVTGRRAATAPDALGDERAYHDFVKANIHTLRGKSLMCWCSLDQPCHADVLLELANRPITPTAGNGEPQP
jgi:Domain of unknown function (DUF4326)